MAELKFPSEKEFCEHVANRVMNEYKYCGKSIKQWIYLICERMESDSGKDLNVPAKGDSKSATDTNVGSKWISVKDRLPNNHQIVLFHEECGFIYCAKFFEGWASGDYVEPNEWFIDNDCWTANNVTHWMPLPQPPTE